MKQLWCSFRFDLHLQKQLLSTRRWSERRCSLFVTTAVWSASFLRFSGKVSTAGAGGDTSSSSDSAPIAAIMARLRFPSYSPIAPKFMSKQACPSKRFNHCTCHHANFPCWAGRLKTDTAPAPVVFKTPRLIMSDLSQSMESLKVNPEL